MKKAEWKSILAGVLCVMLLSMTACSSGKEDTTEKQGSSEAAEENKDTASKDAKKVNSSTSLTMYTSYNEEQASVIFDAFEADTGIHVDYVQLASSETFTRLLAEKDNPQVSMVFCSDAELFLSVKDDDLFIQYETPNLEYMDEAYYKKAEGYYTPYFVGVTAFAVNTEWFEANNLDYPETWEDLLKPEFKDQIVFAHPSSSGTAYMYLSTLCQMWGEDKAFDYLKKLDGNIRHYTKSGTAGPTEVALGEAAIALTMTHDGLKPTAQGYPVEVIAPEDGAGLNIGSMGIVKGGPEEEVENAKVFVDWMTSVRGQETLIDAGTFCIPVNSKAAVTEGLTPLSELNVIDYDQIWSGENKTRLIERFMDEVDNADNMVS
ncbi:ABC transporter substrate-binding protein [Ruminococcus sp. OA3]|uniref:ABC transporter substrate-binding protein n=1 Tax=Ruminococcus sp. OA3 TaxID=2914164 RepID=UPI001F052D9B|nr:ABC transporter substrate-binding protein [Ruminococcus sp. OA3]MCH1981353.1 ABC transporter substrate-binding protein [Ruminococcus sp. OA3]